MELLSQLDVQSPDHVSIITRGNRVTISVRKDGADVTLGFPINEKHLAFNTKLQLQQDVSTTEEPKINWTKPTVVKKNKKILTAEERKAKAARFTQKLTVSSARQIKDMLGDADIMSKFSSNNQAYIQIGQAYGVSYHTVRAIHLGDAWKHIWTYDLWT